MESCSYCGTELDVDAFPVTCSFCNAVYNEKLLFGKYSTDYERSKKRVFKNLVSIDIVNGPITELQKLHTHDLMLALKMARFERTQTYSLVRIFNKATDNDPSMKNDLEEESRQAGDMYTHWTRRMWVIENLLIDRLGYFPERVTDDMIERIRKQSIKALNKKMRIYRERKNYN